MAAPPPAREIPEHHRLRVFNASRHVVMRTFVFAAVLLLGATPPALAQRPWPIAAHRASPPAAQSSATTPARAIEGETCLLAPLVCGTRLTTAIKLGLAGVAIGGTSGLLGGAVHPTRCVGGGAGAGGRGLLLGGALGFVYGFGAPRRPDFAAVRTPDNPDREEIEKLFGIVGSAAAIGALSGGLAANDRLRGCDASVARAAGTGALVHGGGMTGVLALLATAVSIYNRTGG